MAGTDPRLERFFKLNEELIKAGIMSEDALAGQAFEDIVAPTPWLPYSKFAVTKEIDELYAWSLDDPNPWYLTSSPFGGPIANAVALAQLGCRPLLRNFPVSIPAGESSLHAKIECFYAAPVPLGVEYVQEGRLEEKYVRRGRRYLVTEGRFRDAGGAEVFRYKHTRMVGRETTPSKDPPAPRPVAVPTLEGYPAPAPLRKEVDFDKMRTFAGYPETNSVHTDRAFARSRGLADSILQGLHTYAFQAELLVSYFGERWFRGGECRTSFTGLVLPGDVVVTSGRVIGRETRDGVARLVLDVWTENQRGEKVAAATASAPAP